MLYFKESEFENDYDFNFNSLDSYGNIDSIQNHFTEGVSESDNENNESQKPSEGEQQSNSVQILIPNVVFENNSKEKENKQNNQKLLSHKTKRGKTPKSKHTKYADDNMRRKIKHIILNSIFNFINYKIRELYNNNIGKGILEKQLQNLNKKQKSEADIEFNKEFLNKTIEEIFSDDITKKKTSFHPDHNRKLIQDLLNEKNESIKYYFQKLFGLTFLDCLEHFRGSKEFNELIGMNNLENELKKDTYAEKDYANLIIEYSNEYEKIVMKKKSRKKRKTSINGN